MAGKPDTDTAEFLQSRLERQIREQYELHGWAMTVTIANPIDILIMIEEEDETIDPKTCKKVSIKLCLTQTQKQKKPRLSRKQKLELKRNPQRRRKS